MRAAWLLTVLTCCAFPTLAAPPVTLEAPVSDGPIGFGLTDLKAALTEAGYPVGISGAEAWTVQVGVAGSSGLPADGHVPAKPESFALIPQAGSRKLLVLGSDPVGTMYGCLELAERLQMGTSLADVSPAAQSPYLEFRATNPFLSLPYPFTGDLKGWWFLSEDFWRTYLDMLARARFNWVDLHGMYEIKSTGFPNIFPYFVDSKSFPDAGIDDAQKAQNLAMLRRVVTMAAERGIRIALMSYSASWNVPGAPRAPYPSTEDNLATYTREVIAELLRQCPDLGMIGFRIGESGQSEGFYQRSYLPGIADVGLPIPLYTRTWGAKKPAILEIGRAYPGRFLIEIKYNGEHFGLPYIVSGGRMRTWGHYSYQDYCRPPQAYKIVWQNRANGTHRLFRWGDPEWAARAVRSCRWDGAIGHCIESINSYYPQTDTYHRDERLKWFRWVVERDWLWYLLWGRLSYDPELGEGPWLNALRRRFGSEAAPYVLRASSRMSRVVPLIYDSHCLGPDHRNMAPEFETGGPLDRFASVQPLDTFSMQTIAEYVSGVTNNRPSARTNPLQMAQMIQDAAEDAAQQIALARGKVTAHRAELDDWESDITCLRYLAGYYAAKLRAATELELYRATGDPAHWDNAAAQTEKAIESWRKLSEYTAYQYLPFVDMLRMKTESFQWKNLLPEVEKDREVLQRVKEEVGKRPTPPLLGIRATNVPPARLEVTCEPLASTPERKVFRVRVRSLTDLGPAAEVRALLKVKPLPSELDWRARPMTLVDGAYEAELSVTPLGAQWAVEVVGPRGGSCWPDWRQETPYRIVEAWDGPVSEIPGAGTLPDLTRTDLSRDRWGAVLCGRIAKGLNAASSAQKEALLKQVAEGQTLVIFNQNFPEEFDASWLPGGIRGTDADFDACKFLGPHPLLEGVPATLKLQKFVNDALAAGDDQWVRLTDPLGLAVRNHGKGRIILVQLCVLENTADPACARLLRNILAYACEGNANPPLLLDEGNGLVTTALDSLGIAYRTLAD